MGIFFMKNYTYICKTMSIKGANVFKSIPFRKRNYNIFIVDNIGQNIYP